MIFLTLAQDTFDFNLWYAVYNSIARYDTLISWFTQASMLELLDFVLRMPWISSKRQRFGWRRVKQIISYQSMVQFR
jgi:hypothetical protein